MYIDLNNSVETYKYIQTGINVTYNEYVCLSAANIHIPPIHRVGSMIFPFLVNIRLSLLKRTVRKECPKHQSRR